MTLIQSVTDSEVSLEWAIKGFTKVRYEVEIWVHIHLWLSHVSIWRHPSRGALHMHKQAATAGAVFTSPCSLQGAQIVWQTQTPYSVEDNKHSLSVLLSHRLYFPFNGACNTEPGATSYSSFWPGLFLSIRQPVMDSLIKVKDKEWELFIMFGLSGFWPKKDRKKMDHSFKLCLLVQMSHISSIEITLKLNLQIFFDWTIMLFLLC